MASTVPLTQKLRRELIIEYWYRITINDSTISIVDIINIILEYAKLEILKFNKKWMAKNAFTLKYGATMAIKCIKGNRWIMAHIDPVKYGKVCWRVKVT